MSFTPNIWDSGYLQDLRLRSGSKRDGLPKKTMWGHAQYAANRILKDGCFLKLGTVEHPLDKHRTAILLLRSMKVVLDYKISGPDARTIISLAKYLSHAKTPKHAKLKGNFAILISLTAYRTIVKHGRKTD
jgi:hypothetical protein